MIAENTQTNIIGEWNEGISEAEKTKRKTWKKTRKSDKNKFVQDYR